MEQASTKVEHSSGKNIIIMRTILGITQVALARKAKIDSSRLSEIENDHKSPTINELIKLAKALQCKPHKLLPTSMLTDMQEEVMENQANISSNRKDIIKLWKVVEMLEGKLNALDTSS